MRKNQNFEIIVAHYNENLEWLRPYADNVIIYHKWNEIEPRFPVKKWIKLENVWREGHTYLYHIINNYDNLADISVFLQGNISDHVENGSAYNKIEKYLDETKKIGFSMSSLSLLLKKEPQIIWYWKFKDMMDKNNIKWKINTFSDFYYAVFKTRQPSIIYTFYCWNFAVAKERILKREKSFYENIINYLKVSSNPLEWYFLERLWVEIFRKNYFLDYRLTLKYISQIFHRLIIYLMKKFTKFRYKKS